MAKRALPMTWVFARTPSGASYTFRWGRGSGVLTVHSDDRRGSHDDEALLDTVHTGRDWDDDEDVRAVARQWLDRATAATAAKRSPGTRSTSDEPAPRQRDVDHPDSAGPETS